MTSVLLVGCSALSDVDAEFTGGLPGGAGGGLGGAAGAAFPGGKAGASAGASGGGGRAGSSLTAGAAGASKGGAAGAAGSVGGNAAGGLGGTSAGVGGAVGGAAGKGVSAGQGGSGGGVAGSGGAGSPSGAGGIAGKAGNGSAGTSPGGAGGAGNAGGGAGGIAGSGAGGASGQGASGSAGQGAAAGSAGASGGAGQAGAGGSCPGTGSDPDCDGLNGTKDNCPTIPNLDQSDQDADKIGDLCDATPGGADLTTQFGACGPTAGTPAVELLTVPTSTCAGASFAVGYRAGGVPCGSTISFRAFRKAGSSLTSFGGLGNTTSLTGTLDLLAASALTPGEWFLEATVAGVASKRVRIVVGGAALVLTVPSVAALESGPVEISFGTVPSYAATEYTLQLGAAPKSATSPASVPLAGLGETKLTVVAETPDGCSVSRSASIQVETCNPVLPPGTVATPTAPNASFVLVCDGVTHTTANTPITTYARPGATVILGDGPNKVYLSPGATVQPGGGPLTLFYTGPKPSFPGKPVTFVACPSISFDESGVSPTCPIP